MRGDVRAERLGWGGAFTHGHRPGHVVAEAFGLWGDQTGESSHTAAGRQDLEGPEDGPNERMPGSYGAAVIADDSQAEDELAE